MYFPISFRSKMGFLEHWCFHLHQMCWNTSKSWGPYIKGQICQLGPVDTRTNTGKILECFQIWRNSRNPFRMIEFIMNVLQSKWRDRRATVIFKCLRAILTVWQGNLISLCAQKSYRIKERCLQFWGGVFKEYLLYFPFSSNLSNVFLYK